MKIKINITYKSCLEGITDVTERNKAFNNLDDQSKRLEIAWDALQLVLAGNTSAAEGAYWRGDFSDVVRQMLLSPEQLQKEALRTNLQCEVCARGAVMLSVIRLGNELDNVKYGIRDLSAGDYDTVKGFGMGAMRRMEAEYEYSEYETPHKRRTKEKLCNILCNVLVNGNFNGQDRTDYLTITEDSRELHS